jgi:uncharacterized protein (DUF2147 family)
MVYKRFDILKSIHLVFLAGFLSVIFADNPPWYSADTVEGIWRTSNYETKEPELLVRIWSLHDTLYGEVIDVIGLSLMNNPVCQNCTDSLKGAQLKGMRIVWGLTRGDKNWRNGKMRDISDGKVYRCEIQLTENGDLSVFSFVNRVFKVGRTFVWKRD